jgi:prenyltransferase/squalene oxidase-like repeat protein
VRGGTGHGASKAVLMMTASAVLAGVVCAAAFGGRAAASSAARADAAEHAAVPRTEPSAVSPSHQKSIDDIVRFLQEHQQEGGGYADSAKKPTQSVSAWVTLALAAAGINPRNQIRTANGMPCGHSAFEFLAGHFAESLREEIAWPQVGTTAFERELLVVDTAGTDPHDFAGYDLVGEIISRQQPDGGIPFVPGGEAQVNDAVFGILALAPVKEPAAEAAVQKASEWLLAKGEDGDGGFNWRSTGSPSEVDLTGAAIEALTAAEREGTEAEARALAFLREAQRADGGFAEYPSTEGESNVASTAWGVQGIWASGGDPETWRTGSGLATEEPLDYMQSMQQPDGHVRWRASSDLNGIWMTAYVLPAFAGQVLPYPAVPATEIAVEPPGCGETKPTPEAPTEEGLGGGESNPQAGVGAGGGGEGAPDFSRPAPESKGKTPGGARIPHHAKDEKASDHSHTRRGKNLHQAKGTETQEPKRDSEADQEVEKVTTEAGPAATETAAIASGSSGSGGRPTPGDDGRASGARGTLLPADDARRAAGTTGGEEVSGIVIGSPEGWQGKLAFGAPGLRSAVRGGSEEPWVPLTIAVGALVALGLGARRELRGHGWRRAA